MKRIYHLFILCILGVTVFERSYAIDYYVNPNTGDDTNDGLSVNTPFETLTKISDLILQPGDTVFLMDGTYTNPGKTVLTISESGTENARITFQNYPGHNPVIYFDHWIGVDLVNGASYITLRGLKVKGTREEIVLETALNQRGSCSDDQVDDGGARYNGTGINIVGPNLLWSNPETTDDEVSNHIIIEECEVFDCTASGIACQQVDYITIRNNKIYNNSWYTIFGTSGINCYQFINIDGTTGIHNHITNNLMYGNELKVPSASSCQYFDGNGLILDDFKHTQRNQQKDKNIDYGVYSAYTLIANNISVLNGGSGLHFFKSANCIVINNTVYGNAFQNEGENGNADLRIGNCDNFKVKNNVIIATERLHNVSSDNIDLDYTYNFQTGPKIRDNLEGCEGCITDNTSLTFENIDVNSATPFFSKSLIIRNRGINLPDYIDSDFLGEDRPLGAKFDMGAYELSEDIPIDVESIDIGDCPSFTILLGETINLTALITPENATDQSVEWSSSNGSIASIDGSGKVTGLLAGQTTLRVNTNDGNFSKECVINVSSEKVCESVEFEEQSVTSYGSNQDSGEAAIEDDGKTIKIFNNAWKSFLGSYKISEETILEFDFKSTKVGEFHGIGFDQNTLEDDSKIFNLHGTQFYGIMDFRGYEGTDWQNFVIPVGEYYTGDFDRMVFVGDHDIGESDADGYYRNIRIYEGKCRTSGQFTVSNDKTWEIEDDISIYPNPAEDLLFINLETDQLLRNSTYKVLDIHGRLLIEQNLESKKTTVDISQFLAGIYMVFISNGGRQLAKKIVIK